MDNWDKLDGKPTVFSFLKIDIGGHSRIVQGYGYEVIEPIFDAFEDYVAGLVQSRGGQLLSWAGDGGLAAFYKGSSFEKTRACVESAFAILKGLKDFNIRHPFPDIHGRVDDEIRIRIAIHLGEAKYRKQTGRIHSAAINFVSHLEHERTHENSISASEDAYREIKGMEDCRNDFVRAGEFERKEIYTTDQERGTRWERTNPQIGGELSILVAEGKEARVRELFNPTPESPLVLTWDTFGMGMHILKEQIEKHLPPIQVTLCIGINFAGTQIAAFLSDTLRRCAGFLGTVKTVHGMDRSIDWQSVPQRLKRVNNILVVDSELKSGASARMVVDALKRQYPSARVWLAVLTWCGVQTKRGTEPLTVANPANCPPNFLAFVTKGRVEPPAEIR